MTKGDQHRTGIASEPLKAPGLPWTADTYRIYDGTDENGIAGTLAPGLFGQEGRYLAHGLREPSRPGWARHRARDVTAEGPGLLTQPSQFHERRLTVQLSNGYLAARNEGASMFKIECSSRSRWVW